MVSFVRATVFRKMDVLGMLMYFFLMALNKIKLWRCYVWNSKRHSLESVTTSQLTKLFKRHTFEHLFFWSAVKHFFAVPAPHSLPSFVRVDLESVKTHDKTSRAAITRFWLSRELLREAEVILHATSWKRLLKLLLTFVWSEVNVFAR